MIVGVMHFRLVNVILGSLWFQECLCPNLILFYAFVQRCSCPLFGPERNILSALFTQTRVKVVRKDVWGKMSAAYLKPYQTSVIEHFVKMLTRICR